VGAEQSHNLSGTEDRMRMGLAERGHGLREDAHGFRKKNGFIQARAGWQATYLFHDQRLLANVSRSKMTQL
jgi:hypothetical protein